MNPTKNDIAMQIAGMGPRYVIERWPHGWVLCGANGVPGIPTDALNECTNLFPKKAGIYSGIVHHLREMGRYKTVICVALEADAKKWYAEIEKAIKHMPAQERWWKGLDVGKSSAAVFAVFCEDQWRRSAEDVGEASTPRDADDFGRCKRLLDLFPEWRARLGEVAKKYYSTLWPPIIDRWAELEAAPQERQSAILREIAGGTGKPL